MIFKVIVKKIRIFKIRAPYQLNGVVSTLAHTADIRNSHGKEYKEFNTLGIFGDSTGIKHTFGMAIRMRQHFKSIEGHQLIGYKP